MFHFLKKLIPQKIFAAIQPAYHFCLAALGALLYGFPSRKIRVVAVTGTKGKTTVTELVSHILEYAGYTTALSNTVHFKIGDRTESNLYKMSMPGRFFLQDFIWRARKKKCNWVVVEMTSEGAKQSRHRFIELDALIFTNLAPEHIESHGSYELYREAKLSIGTQIECSRKETIVVANKDDEESVAFLALKTKEQYGFSLDDARPFEASDKGIAFHWKEQLFLSPLLGEFNLSNILAAATFAAAVGIPVPTIREAVRTFGGVAGRMQFIEEGQRFRVIVDYAHTPESLKAVYGTFPRAKKICVLGSTGGGRDRIKRPTLGKLAAYYCESVIVTNEDPYDEDPRRITNDVASETSGKAEIIIDRREAIRAALARAADDALVIVTGKGTDPYIMGPHGSKTPWSDERVIREELRQLLDMNNGRP